MTMQRRWMVITLSVAVLAGGVWLVGRGRAKADPGVETPTKRDSIELTIYNNDFGMVRETRPLQLTLGSNRLHVQQVSNGLDPQSVSLQWKGENNLPEIIAQSYDLGVSNGDALLKRYLGQSVELVRYGDNGKEAERQKGRLMVQGNGAMVLESDGSFYVNPQGTLVAPANNDIVTIPQLSIQADSPTQQAANLNVAYLTRGMSWTADYIGTLSQDQPTLSLECWATVTNRTGVDYPNAHVSLVTGSPNRAVVKDRAMDMEEKAKAGLTESDGYFASRMSSFGGGMPGRKNALDAPVTVGEFHAYPISKPTTVVQEQMNRLRMLSSEHVSAVMDYNTRMPDLSAWDDVFNWGPEQPSRRGTVAVSMSFYNTEKNGLGQPLPHGDIRLYEPDAAGALQYVGAAQISDTPLDQRIDITLANAFDLFTEWREVRKQKIEKHTMRKQIELTLHNEKAKPIEMRVVQGFGGRWKIVNEPIKHVNLDSSEAQWKIPVPAKSKTVFTYSVDLSF